MKTIVVGMAAWLVLGAASARAQTASAPGAPVGRPLEFDVVSVRENRAPWGQSHPDYNDDGDEIRIENYSLRRIIQQALNFRRGNMVFGLPEWARASRYDLVGKVTEADLPAFRALSDTERAAMLVPILAERFHLKTHVEMREMPVFALELAKGGPKMTPAAENASGEVEWTGDHELTSHGAKMTDLVYTLSGSWNVGLERPVIDRTGLTGRYDFKLRFSPVRREDDDEDDDPNDPGVWIFTAVERQLGLKLVPTKGRVECLVIDAIEPLTEN